MWCSDVVSVQLRVCLPYSVSTPSFSIVVNTTSSVKRYQFAKVFWDYTESAEGSQGDVVARDGLVSEKSAASHRKPPFASVGVDRVAQVASPSNKKPERAGLLYRACFQHTPTKCRAQGEHAQVYLKNSANAF